jgi:hypothetical protein
MANILKSIGVTIIALLTLFIYPLLTPLVGAFGGLVLGFVFPITFRDFLDALHFTMLQPWQFGLMAGFTGGFFRRRTGAKA